VRILFTRLPFCPTLCSSQKKTMWIIMFREKRKQQWKECGGKGMKVKA
jgi:hypothetical protein